MMRNSGGYAWLVLLILTAVYEGWAAGTRHQTMSEWVWFYSRGHEWFKMVFISLVLSLLYHLFLTGRS